VRLLPRSHSRSAWRTRRACAACGAAALSATLLASLTRPPVAYADIAGCRSDPALLLSNLVELDVSSAIADTAADVQQVTYTVHIPVGTRPILIVAGSLGAREVWRVVADNPPDTYDTSTLVTTFTHRVGVQATTQALGLVGAPLVTIAGQDHQELHAHVSL